MKRINALAVGLAALAAMTFKGMRRRRGRRRRDPQAYRAGTKRASERGRDHHDRKRPQATARNGGSADSDEDEAASPAARPEVHGRSREQL